MNRETESHFSHLPTLNIKRSSFKRPSTHKTSWNCSDLIPIYVDSDILPGDSVKMRMAEIVRMQTPIFPVMDNAYMDIYFFFVPHRIVWEHWKEFWGENNLTAWEQQVPYEIPQIEAPATTGWTEGTIADYMGIPTGIDEISVNHLPFRAYVKCWNDWFRDENLKDPAFIQSDETTLTGANSGSYVTSAQLGAKPLKVAKYHDYFTSALPAPQKGPSINLPLGSIAPVIGTNEIAAGQTLGSNMIGENIVAQAASSNGMILISKDSTALNPISLAAGSSIGLAADLSNAIGATINQLRQAFAVQAFYEAQSRGGSRYIEFIKNIFGVTSPDGRLQRSEYLGGTRVQINMDQVLQTSSTDNVSPQGNTAAFSCTVNSEEDLFTHSFTEHGTLIGLACIRTDHTYQQGINRMWSRKKWTDFYVPQLANLGEVPILNKEIFAQGDSVVDSDGNIIDDQVFGYQEAWADYRYMPSRVSGEMRSSYNQSLDSWHYADDYNSLPTLSSSWIDETEDNVDRTISVQHSTANQFFGDFYFDPIYIRPMPVYSIPAMLNHF